MNVMIVDDEPSFRLLAGEMLKEEGHSVILADDGDDGLVKIKQQPIDLVISDLHMHALDGLEFCKAVREIPRCRNIPFLFVSAYEDDGTRAAINSIQDAAFLRKGEPVSELIRWIRYLTGSQPNREMSDPAHAGMEEGGAAAAKPAGPGAGGSLILIADDDEGVRLSMEEVLVKEGYFVLAASDGFEALDLLKQYHFDLVLLDIVMPGISGLEILKYIHLNMPSTKVIMITAYGDLKLAVETRKAGAYDFVAKPFMRADLMNTIKTALSK